ncbi:MAG: outer membrane lipoprotein-sorting protein [Spirochaetota bacterium]
MTKIARAPALIALGLWICLAAVSAHPQDRPSADEVVKRIDELYRADSSYAEMEMAIITPNWERTLRMRAWSEGTEKTFIRILEPRKERGVGTLRIENEMWNYLPNANRVMRIPPSMMMSSWMGSDFNNNDLVRQFTFTEDYDFDYAEVDDPDEGILYIRAVPKEGRPIVWGHVMLEIHAESLLPRAERYFDDEGDLARVMRFSEVESFDDRRIPSVLELVPQDEEGNRTVLRYLEAEFDIDIPEGTFTQRNLRTFRN